MRAPGSAAHPLVICSALTCILLVYGRASAAPATTQAAGVSMDQIAANLAANLAQVRTYAVSGQVTSSDKNASSIVFEAEWEHTPQSGLDYFDKRFYTEKVFPTTAAIAAGQPAEIRMAAFDGKVAYLQDEMHKWERGLVSIRGETENKLTARMYARGLTYASLATHLLDLTPIERVVANGTFEIEGTENVEGHACVVIYGKYALSGQPDCKRGTPGTYLRFCADPAAGCMPLRQEWYAVREANGDRGQPITIVTASVQEVQKGIWLPVSGTERNAHGGVVYQLKMDRIEINPQFEPDHFRINWAPGTMVDDKVNGRRFRVPR